MKNALGLILCIFIFTNYLEAQNKTVLLEPQKRKINQGNPLPVQTPFDIQVPVGSTIGIIRINVFKGNHADDVIEKAYWSRPAQFNGDLAELPIDVRLKSGNKYGFDVKMYAILSDTEKVALREILHHNLSNYLDASIEAGNKSFTVSKSPGQIVQDLNSIVKRNLQYYQNTQQRPFEGFSDIVSMKIQQIQKTKLSNAEYNVKKKLADSSLDENEVKALYAKQLGDELNRAVFTEIDNYLSLDFVKQYDSFAIGNRETEKGQTVLPLFVGYGGVYLGGPLDDLEYDSQPYAGLSFPLGRGNETHYGRTSFIMGLFLKNFKGAQNQTITGPIIDRPFFAGLGYRIYDFINFNAGVVTTSTEKQSISNFKSANVQLRPFIGFNAQFNLWLGLNKK